MNRLAIFLFVFVCTITINLDFSVQAGGDNFKKIFELKANKKDPENILTFYAFESKDKEVNKPIKYWSDKITSSYFRDDLGKQYRMYSDQLKNKGINLGVADIDASKPGRRIDGLNIEDDSTEMMKRDRANLYLRSKDFIGRIEVINVLNEVIYKKYIPQVKDQQKINESPRIRGYKIFLVDDLQRFVLNSDVILNNILRFKTTKSDFDKLQISSNCSKCACLADGNKIIEINLRELGLFAKDEAYKKQIAELLIQYASSSQFFVEGMTEKDENGLILLEYPNYMATKSALYISVDFFRDGKRLAIAEEEINKNLPLKDKNTKKAKEKNLLEQQMLLQSVSLIEQQYFLWMFIGLYKDSIAEPGKVDSFSLFRSTMIELIEDEFDNRR